MAVENLINLPLLRRFKENLETEIDNKLEGKQNNLTFDTTPTEGSTNPVTSGGIKSALTNIEQQIAGISSFEPVVADKLPTASASTMNKLYLVPAEDSKEGNTRDEYVTVGEEKSFQLADLPINTPVRDKAL